MNFLMEQFIKNPKKLFLTDSIGALLCAFFLGFVLVGYEEHFGMPVYVLYALASIASVYAVYSICCSIFLKENFTPFLIAVLIANIFYFFLTIEVVYYFREELTGLGIIYFILELTIMLWVILVENKVLKGLNKLKDVND